MSEIKFLRYTNLASTIHILQSRCLTLLNPETWPDRNDSFYIAEYKRRTKALSVLALCFAESKETFHHWGVFAPGCDGVCIEFDKQMLFNAVHQDPELEVRKVDYRLIKDVLRECPRDGDLPFVKRDPYEPENEFRIVFTSKTVQADSKILPISHRSIRHITLSPWMPDALVGAVRDTLKSIKGSKTIAMHRSGLLDNESWRRAVEPELKTTV